MDWENATIAVTGGGGFIGSHLVRYLVAQGAKRVFVIDNFSYGTPENLDAPGGSVEIVPVAIGAGCGAVLQPVLQPVLSGVDYLFHFAAEKHNQSIDQPAKVLDVNVSGTFELLEAARQVGVKKVVFSSSLYAYGRMTGGPFVETELPQPETVYGASKLTGEHLCHYFSRKHGLKSVSLRFLFVYGPRQYANQGYKSVIVKNFERLLDGQPPIINGDGQQVLDYIYVDDVVACAAEAMLSPTLEDRVVNVASGQGTSVESLVALMQKVAGTNYLPQRAPADGTHGTSRVGDVSVMRNAFAHHPQVSLEEGLRATWNWMQTRVNL